MTDKLTLQTAHARVVSRGGILAATVTGGEQRSLFARLVNAPPMDTLRVWEGQARVEPLNGEGKAFSLKAGSEVSLKSGMAGPIADIQSDSRVIQPLAIREEHQGLPQPVMRQIIRAHVDLALEVEKELQRASAAGNENELPGTTTKGAILATTTGLPSLPGTQALVGGNTTGTSSISYLRFHCFSARGLSSWRASVRRGKYHRDVVISYLRFHCFSARGLAYSGCRHRCRICAVRRSQ